MNLVKLEYMWHKLTFRLTVLALAIGFACMVGLVIVVMILHGLVGSTAVPRTTPWAPIFLAMLRFTAVVGIPLIISWFGSRLVIEPLRKFTAAIQNLQASNYKAQLKPTGIDELDQVFNSFNELTRRLQAEEDLRKDLISDTSHEFNTPLTALVGHLTAMQEGKVAIDKERIDVLKGQADRLVGLMSGLDAYTRARIPDSEPTEVILLQELCQEIIKSNELELARKHIRVELAVTRDVSVNAHRHAVRQILENVIQNALRYSHASKIAIIANAAQITITDNGIGVPAESLPHLFERFYRVEKSRSRDTGGMGLGLSIVKELVERQGWRITAEDAHPGLRFTITF